ncbi:Glycoside hydrolase superfamily [Rhypophila sp. PSN 637]
MTVTSGDEGTAGGGLGKGVDVSRRTGLTLIGILAVVTVALVLGLGLGFGLNHNGSDSQSPNPPHPTPSNIWQPAVKTSWQIILSQELAINHSSPSITPDVEVFDIDMFVHLNTTIIGDLHKLNKKVICYFSAGSYEPYRRDSDKFQDSDMGNVLNGWWDEKWLNITSPHVRGIMSDRIDLAASLGCDAIDPDNMDGYLNDSGLDITTDEAVDYVKFLADKAKAKNMAIGLKNAPDLIPYVLDIVQFAVNEQCAAQDDCAGFSAFIEAGKPVFHIEYPSGAGRNIAASASKKSCTAKNMAGFSTVMKELKLGAWVEYCDGTTAYTNIVD